MEFNRSEFEDEGDDSAHAPDSGDDLGGAYPDAYGVSAPGGEEQRPDVDDDTLPEADDAPEPPGYQRLGPEARRAIESYLRKGLDVKPLALAPARFDHLEFEDTPDGRDDTPGAPDEDLASEDPPEDAGSEPKDGGTIDAGKMVIVDPRKANDKQPLSNRLSPDAPVADQKIFIIGPDGSVSRIGPSNEVTFGGTGEGKTVPSDAPPLADTARHSYLASDKSSGKSEALKDMIARALEENARGVYEVTRPPSAVPALSNFTNALRAETEKQRIELRDETRAYLRRLYDAELRKLKGITEDGADVRAFLESLSPLDGRQPSVPADQQKAAGAAVTEAITQYLEGKNPFSDLLGAYDRTKRYDPETGKTYVVTIDTLAEGVAEEVDTKHMVTIKEDKPDGPGAGVFYEVSPDAITRRTDIAEPTPDEREAAEAAVSDMTLALNTPNMAKEEIRDAMRFFGRLLADFIGNRELEETFGLRRQPIGPDEARRLAALILRRPFEPADASGAS